MEGKMGKREGNIPAWPGIMELQKEQPVERPGKNMEETNIFLENSFVTQKIS